MDRVVDCDASKVSDDSQTARKNEKEQATIDRPQKHALVMDDTRDSKKMAIRVGIASAQGRDKVIVVDDVEKVPVPLDNNSAEVAAGSTHSARITLASSSNVDASSSASSSPSSSKAVSMKCKEKKTILTSVVATIESRRKQAVPVTKEPMALPMTAAKEVPVTKEVSDVLEVPEVPLRQDNLPSKPATAKVTPKMAEPGPLSGVRMYVIPAGMSSTVFSFSREQVIQMGGKWLGPRRKVTDPRVAQMVPTLNQTTTTHIVTALKSVDVVKWHFGIEEIDPRITIVNKEWLTHTIMYKKPMDPEGYLTSRRPIIIPVREEGSLEGRPPLS
ncbi:hypothetical protein BGZ50_009234 [Haplosporangium sp. Z 11]|nr:hypothetical protein BGZ50_009234 [Haplosporangium sp. Z 11]